MLNKIYKESWKSRLNYKNFLERLVDSRYPKTYYMKKFMQITNGQNSTKCKFLSRSDVLKYQKLGIQNFI